MAYDEDVAMRLRELFAPRDDVTERKMFGGLAFMVRGHMCCGLNGDALMARVGPEQYEAALARPHAREMAFTGRPMRGFVHVDPAGYDGDDELREWVAMCERFVESLPPK